MTSLGSVAVVNLRTGEVEISRTPPALVEKFLGGRGLNMVYLRRFLPPDAGPLGPDNPLIIGAGLLTGALAPNASRWNVTARSPETGHLGDSNCGGFFGAEMRRAGFDRLIVLGRAERPTFIHLEDGRIELRDATAYWGLRVRETQVRLREDMGKDVEVACIGPAGEHQVRFAAVMTGIKDAAGRCGMGAVMGSKNLKAVTAYGSLGVPVADPRGLFDYCLELKAHLKRSKITEVLGRVGTPLLYEVSNRLGAIRTRNSQDNYFEDTLNAEEIERYAEKMLSCAGCLVHCRHRNTLGGEGPEYSTIGLLGANCGVAPTDQVIALNNQVNDLGMDSSSAGTIIAWAMELYQRGIIDRGMTGQPLRWGDYEVVRQLLDDIAYRRGFGNILAESSQAMRYFPPEARDYLIAVKNLPQSDPHDVRYVKSFALGIAVASRGADHLRNRPTLEIFRLPERLVTEIYGQPIIQDPTAYETKGVVVAFSDDIYATIDCLGLCKFICHGFNSPHLLKYEHFAELIRLITGLELSPQEVHQAGRRVVDLERMINADFGLTAADDTLPRRYFEEPMPARTTQGHRIEREGFAAMLADYYAQRGWDAAGRVSSDRAMELDGLVEGITADGQENADGRAGTSPSLRQSAALRGAAGSNVNQSAAFRKAVDQQQNVPMGVSKSAASRRSAIVADARLCTGCGLCALACSTLHTGECNPRLSGIIVERDPFRRLERLHVCHQCGKAPCVSVCATGALFHDHNRGVVGLDPALCDGCWVCIEACPFEQDLVRDLARQVVIKCDLCPELEEPACVAICPTAALRLRVHGRPAQQIEPVMEGVA